MKHRGFIYFIRGMLAGFFAWALSKLTLFILLAISLPFDSTLHSLPTWSIRLVCCVALVLIFNSLIRFLTLYDRAQRDAFVEEDRDVYFISELRLIIKDRVFILETAGALILLTLISLVGGMGELAGVFVHEGEPDSALIKFLPLAVYIPLTVVISLVRRYDLRRYFRILYIKGELDALDSRFKMLLRLFAIFVLYPLVFPYAPLLVFVLFSFASIFVSLTALLTVAGFIALCVLLILLIVGIAYIRAISRRKKFIRSLTQLAEQRGYTLSEIKDPVRSFFKPSEGVSFTLTRGTAVYSVRFLSTVRRGVRLYFTSDKHAYLLHRIGSDRHHISFHHNIDWGFDGEGVKILLINPYPKRVFAIAQNGATRQLISGDRLYDTIVYDDISLLGAIDRDCLGRTN